MDRLYLEVLIGKLQRNMFDTADEVREDIESAEGVSDDIKGALLRNLVKAESVHVVLKIIQRYFEAKYFTGHIGVAKFEKVSFGRFHSDIKEEFPDLDYDEILRMYDEYVKIPERATSGSAGYDFITPVDIALKPGESIKIPTGIRCQMLKNWVLMCYPRSGHGFKYRVQLDNTVAVIDSDYYYSDNEGHIFIKITNDGKSGKDFKVNAGEAICQGIFSNFGITFDDDATGLINGGFGSTDV